MQIRCTVPDTLLSIFLEPGMGLYEMKQASIFQEAIVKGAYTA